MKFSLLFFTCSLYLFSSLLTVASAKIYHWVDEDGKIHFSDTAVPGTEEVNIKDHNLLSEDKKEDVQAAPITNDLSLDEFSDDEEPAIDYQATITSPEDDKPLRSNDGTINIHVATVPEKENTHKLQLYLDGKKLGSPQISPTIRALNIDRGTHQVQVDLLDENGRVLAKTQVVTVHLLRAGKK